MSAVHADIFVACCSQKLRNLFVFLRSSHLQTTLDTVFAFVTSFGFLLTGVKISLRQLTRCTRYSQEALQ